MTPNEASAQQTHRYSADRPLEATADDQLDRAGFADRLAADIIGWHGKDSLVISLNGDWGSGKSTLKNFLKERLAAKGRPIVVEFNPWAWSAQEKLIEGFFRALHVKFRETDERAETQRLAERWESLERWTRFGAEISESVNKSLAPLFGGSVVMALITNNAQDAWLRIGGVTIGLAGVLVTSFLAAFPSLASQMVVYARHKAGKAKLTLSDLRKKITEQLDRLRIEKRPVVMIIDDIDAEEIQLVFQLVKVNADFPNLVYLLLFQSNIVTKALGKISADSGEDYLKKIIQVPMDVPQASRARMQAIFFKGLDQIIDDQKVKMRWDRQRFLDLFEDNLWPYFGTLRDVKRFLGTFDFYYHGHVENAVLQVNPVDLLAVEVLRTFDRDAYIQVRDSFGLNLPKKYMKLLFGDEERRKEVTVEVDLIVQGCGRDEAHRRRLRSILIALFPVEFGDDERTNAERDYRVCHPDHFSRYFEHSPDRQATSAANLDALFGILGDRAKLASKLLELNERRELEPVFAKLALYFEEIPANIAEGFIGALFDVGDSLPDASLGWFNQDPYVSAGRMVYFFLGKLPDSFTRAQVLERCLADTSGHAVPTVAIGLLTGAIAKKGEVAFIAEPHLAPLRTLVLERIKALAASGDIWKSRHLPLFLYRWRDWAGQAEVNAWLHNALTTSARKADFLGRMTQKSVINGSRIEHYLNGALLESFVNLDQLAADIEHVPENNLDEHQARARRLLQRAVKLKANGKGYSEVREHGDFGPELWD
jgi:predicted KAP-like P-loop ATPase